MRRRARSTSPSFPAPSPNFPHCSTPALAQPPLRPAIPSTPAIHRPAPPPPAARGARWSRSAASSGAGCPGCAACRRPWRCCHRCHLLTNRQTHGPHRHNAALLLGHYVGPRALTPRTNTQNLASIRCTTTTAHLQRRSCWPRRRRRRPPAGQSGRSGAPAVPGGWGYIHD